MMTQNTQKNRNHFSLLLKWAIAVLAVLFIYSQLNYSSKQDWWSAAWLAFTEMENLHWLFLAVALLPLNLSLEAVKWQVAMLPLEQVRFSVALRAVFSGLTVSVFTPNRIGEYAGRVFVLQKADRISATLLTIIASFSQLVITLLAGTAAVFNYDSGEDAITAWLAVPFLILLPILSFVFLLIYFKVRKFQPLFEKLPLPATWKTYASSFHLLPASSLFRILLLAAVRYLVFTFQFYLLLKFFSVDISYTVALTCMALVYLSMLLVPTVTLTELGVRGGLAMAWFAGYTDALQEVVFASSLLWLINLILPSLIGCLFVFKFKFFRTAAA